MSISFEGDGVTAESLFNVGIDRRWLADWVALEELIVSEIESGLEGREGFKGFMMVGLSALRHA